ncbi:MAG: hypothetical protein VX642_14670 [Bdellovibrionota bacterium]|nr:hypothetical protein [Bdellovibrionota bacterium]
MSFLFRFFLFLTLSINVFSQDQSPEYQAGLLLGKFSVEKAYCNEVECINLLHALKDAFEQIDGPERTEQLILANILTGSLVSELSVPMKKAINGVYPEWKDTYFSLNLKQYVSLHLDCGLGSYQVFQVQEFPEDDAMYTYYFIEDGSGKVMDDLSKDYLSETNISYYDMEDNLVGEFEIDTGMGYLQIAGEKKEIKGCELINY